MPCLWRNPASRHRPCLCRPFSDSKPTGSPKPLQPLPTPILTIAPHPGVQPQLAPQQPPPPALGTLKLAPTEEVKSSEQKKRPGGIGTREVHNKLEKNRHEWVEVCHW
ncbi:Max-binding protein MNT [Myotis davidii]|uniref:Max-binding protein MNT n=1 Tax=Myotis davidii TaxID=225400 RepID=L5LLV0_MYODS|nr:Max-binding protein MNT [Myotis davidii]